MLVLVTILIKQVLVLKISANKLIVNDDFPRAIEKFHSYCPQIEELINCNSQFKEICSNYEDCIKVLVYLKSKAIYDFKIFREYLELSQELEQEINRFLKKD